MGGVASFHNAISDATTTTVPKQMIEHRFSHDLRSRRLCPEGLQNLNGKTCWFNAVMQGIATSIIARGEQSLSTSRSLSAILNFLIYTGSCMLRPVPSPVVGTLTPVTSERAGVDRPCEQLLATAIESLEFSIEPHPVNAQLIKRIVDGCGLGHVFAVNSFFTSSVIEVSTADGQECGEVATVQYVHTHRIGGHVIAYVRRGSLWWKVDDGKATRVGTTPPHHKGLQHSRVVFKA